VRHLDHLGGRRRRQPGQGLIVENKNTPGFSVEKMQNKIALKWSRTVRSR